ncbi:hypothetical protein FS749_003042 [Ceratobasidium sp. UAMH 11750]|nr:hypothetical protein FS749_003042 [Ceratobasidium sp. UAMH 11750]
MPPPNFYHDRWPHPAPENTQNPSMWMQAPAQAASAPYFPLPPHPHYRRSPQRMDGRATHPQTPPVASRLRTGSNYDPYAAESEYGPYYFEENVSFSVSVPSSQRGSGQGGHEYTYPRRDGLAPTERDWIFPNNPHDGMTAQLTGRIEMLRQRIGAVERSREQEQRAGRDQSLGSEPTLPPAHQGVRWAYPAENRPGFWETGYGQQSIGHGDSERRLVTPRSRTTSSTSMVRANIPPPVVVPPPETMVPPAPVTGHKVYVLNCKNCGMFLSNRGMKAVLLLRPNIALFSTDAMPVNCSPQPSGGQRTSDDQCDRHPQDITHLVRGTRPASPVRQQVEETLYARFFLPVKREVTEKYPETPSPERSADLAPGAYPTPTQSLPRTCECLTQTLSCHGCGAGIGYMIVTPCARCTAQQNIGGRPGQPQRTANGHRFVFHHAEIVARERLYVPGQSGVHRYPWGIPPSSDPRQSPTLAQQPSSRSRMSSADSEPKSPSIPVFQPHRDGNFVPIVSPVPARAAPTRRVQNTGLKPGDVVFWHHLGRTGELGGVSMVDDDYERDYVER